MNEQLGQSQNVRPVQGAGHWTASSESSGSWVQSLLAAGVVIGSLSVGIAGVPVALFVLFALATTGLAVGGGYLVLRAILPDTFGGNIVSVVAVNGTLLCVLPIIAVAIVNRRRIKNLLTKDLVTLAILAWILLTMSPLLSQMSSLPGVPKSVFKVLLRLVTYAVPLVLFPYLYGRMSAQRPGGLASLRSAALVGLLVLFALACYEYTVQHPIDGWLPTGEGLSYKPTTGYAITFGRYRVAGMFRNGLYVGTLACLYLVVVLFVTQEPPLSFLPSIGIIAVASITALFFGISRTGSIGVVLAVMVWLFSRAARRGVWVLVLGGMILGWLLYGPSVTDFILTGGAGSGRYLLTPDRDPNYLARKELYARLLNRDVPLLAFSQSDLIEAVKQAPALDMASGWLVLLYSYGLLPVLTLLGLLGALTAQVLRVFRKSPSVAAGLLLLIWIAPFLWLTTSERMADPLFWMCVGVCHQAVQGYVPTASPADSDVVSGRVQVGSTPR